MASPSSKKRNEPEETERLSSEEILTIVKEISEHSGSSKDKQRIFRKKYPDFAEYYPVLFTMSSQEGFDFARLRYMLHLRNNIDESKVSQHDASAKVGQMLYDSYVKDKIKDVPPTK